MIRPRAITVIAVVALTLIPAVLFAQNRPPAGTVPLYRLTLGETTLSPARYTCNRNERNGLMGKGWSYQGIVCYVYPTPWRYEPGDEPSKSPVGSPAPTPSAAVVVGRWTYTAGSFSDEFHLHPAGTVSSKADSKAKGTWSLDGTTITLSWGNGWRNVFPASPSPTRRSGTDHDPKGRTQGSSLTWEGTLP